MSSTSKEDLSVSKPEVQAHSELASARITAGDDGFEVFKKDIEGGEAYRTNGVCCAWGHTLR